jgi:hypothetical protein
MLSQIATDQAIPQQHSAESARAADSGIAAVWLIYLVALGIALSSPLMSAAIEFAALITG